VRSQNTLKCVFLSGAWPWLHRGSLQRSPRPWFSGAASGQGGRKGENGKGREGSVPHFFFYNLTTGSINFAGLVLSQTRGNPVVLASQLQTLCRPVLQWQVLSLQSGRAMLVSYWFCTFCAAWYRVIHVYCYETLGHENALLFRLVNACRIQFLT